jgi:MFS family permease
VLAIATVAYTPSASSLVVELAPTELRGVYLSINSLCWAVGYAIGPPLGGWAMDQPRPWADLFWLGLAASIGICLLILMQLAKISARRLE